MIDLHAHILYGIDDGAQHVEMTLNMLRQAEEDHIGTMVATPHYVAGALIYRPEVLRARYEDVLHLIKEEGINIRLFLGNELFLDEYIFEAVESKECHTLADTSYVLLELPMAGIPLETEKVLYRFLTKGYRPILAHPERNAAVLSNPALLLNLLEMGCITQLNSGSITGNNGRRIQGTARLLLESNMAHLVASDCHSDNRRPPALTRAYKLVSAWLGDKRAYRLFYDNPERVLRDEGINIGSPPRLIQREKGLRSRIKGCFNVAK